MDIYKEYVEPTLQYINADIERQVMREWVTNGSGWVYAVLWCTPDGQVVVRTTRDKYAQAATCPCAGSTWLQCTGYELPELN